ncbi:amidohydrolase family protein [Sorangium sp. So ce1151]|uniref:amidohydrolase family protein n=1 Tax=Sorangium sp. So ce1151 TaxID=3133332 RepID=UPI003F5E439C
MVVQGLTLFDGHCHVASDRFIPKTFVRAVIENIKVKMAASGLQDPGTRLLDYYFAQIQDHLADRLIADMDRAGVAQALLLLPDFTYCFKEGGLTIAEMIEEHAQIIARHRARVHVLCGVDPRWGADGLALFERAVTELGFSGLKVYPPCGFSPSDRMLYPFYEICRQRRLPVLVHSGPTSPALPFGTAHPSEIDRAACDFADVNFILGHGGVNQVQAAVEMCAYRPNVYLDFSGFPAIIDAAGPLSGLRRLFGLGLNHKIIFGTDWPVFGMMSRYPQLVSMICSDDGPLAEVSEPHRRWLLGDNVRRLLGSAARDAGAHGETGSPP